MLPLLLFLEGVQCSGNTSLETSQDSALQIMWDTLDFSWGYPEDGANVDIGDDDDVDDGPTGEGTQLALEDGSVHDDDESSEVDTTQPEQTSDEIEGLMLNHWLMRMIPIPPLPPNPRSSTPRKSWTNKTPS